MYFISEDINSYCQKFTTKESKVAADIQKNTDENLEYSNMLSGKVVGQLLALLIKISGTKKALEVGTFTGYSAIRIAEALPEDGSLITLDYNERYANMAQAAFDRSDHGHKITLKMGKALETLQTLDEQFDFIFLDADKANYPAYYKSLFPKLKGSGLLIVDNVLWSGKVLQPDDEQAEAIHQLNKMIAEDSRAEQVMLPVRDGLTIVRKVRE